MKRPSKRAVLIGGGFFVLGFAIAIAVVAAVLFQFARESWHAEQGSMVSALASTTQLLDSAEQRPSQLIPEVLGNSVEQSLGLATQFDTLGDTYQPIVLRVFAHLQQNTTLRAQHGPATNAARLARVMVLCTHHLATPGWVKFGKDQGGTVGVPSWVLTPDAAPDHPAIINYHGLRFIDPRQVGAITRQWDALHAWVNQHRACAAANHL